MSNLLSRDNFHDEDQFNCQLTVLLLAGANANVLSSPMSICKSLCRDVRQRTLGDVSACKGALDQHRNLFDHCAKGRKKGYDQSCILVCTGDDASILSSYDICQDVAKTGGQKANDWCRKVRYICRFSMRSSHFARIKLRVIFLPTV